MLNFQHWRRFLNCVYLNFFVSLKVRIGNRYSSLNSNWILSQLFFLLWLPVRKPYNECECQNMELYYHVNASASDKCLYTCEFYRSLFKGNHKPGRIKYYIITSSTICTIKGLAKVKKHIQASHKPVIPLLFSFTIKWCQ